VEESNINDVHVYEREREKKDLNWKDSEGLLHANYWCWLQAIVPRTGFFRKDKSKAAEATDMVVD
jgi:hypothetical protein